MQVTLSSSAAEIPLGSEATLALANNFLSAAGMQAKTPSKDIIMEAPTTELLEDEDASIDALVELIEAAPGVDEAREHDVEELLGYVAPVPGSSSPLLFPRSAPVSVVGAAPLDHGESSDLLPDLPDPKDPLPPEIVATPFISLCRFHLRCEVDLKKVAFGIRHAEYNPRKHSSITVRLFDPRSTALVRASGSVAVTSALPEDELKRSAKRIAKLIQRCGHEDAKFADFRVTSILCKADLQFPVRLDALASRFRRNALYEPEFFSNCVFRTRKPRVTYLVTAGGKVMISGLKCMADINEALRRVYFVFRDFRS